MKCSRCSRALISAADFTARVCEACRRGEEWNPLAGGPADFLRGLLAVARPSLDDLTAIEARERLESLIVGIYPKQAGTYPNRVDAISTTHVPTDSAWKGRHLPVTASREVM